MHSLNGNKVDSLAQQVEHIPFKDGVLGSSPRRITERRDSIESLSFFYISNKLPIRPIMRTYHLRCLSLGSGQRWGNYSLYKQVRILLLKIFLTKKTQSIGTLAMEAMVLEVMFAVTIGMGASL